jgi:hypothetical protein
MSLPHTSTVKGLPATTGAVEPAHGPAGRRHTQVIRCKHMLLGVPRGMGSEVAGITVSIVSGELATAASDVHGDGACSKLLM